MSWYDRSSRSKRVGATLAFSYLFARHAAFEFIAGFGCIRQTLRGCKSEPFIRFNAVLCDAVTFLIAHPQIVLGQSTTVVGRLPIPLDGFGNIPRHAFAHDVKHGQRVLPGHMALLCGPAIPLGSFGFVARHALAGFVQFAQGGLRSGISLIRRLPVPLGSFSVTLLHALALGADRTKLILSFSISAFGIGPGAFKVNDFRDFGRRNRR